MAVGRPRTRGPFGGTLRNVIATVRGGLTPVGRAAELATLAGALARASAGEPVGLLLLGEAGVGKTCLVRAACAEASGTPDVLWAPCLPLGRDAAPLLPLRAALRGRGVLAENPTLRDVPAAVDAWLDVASAQRSVVLVVDDLHWADRATLDVLMYALAGERPRRLAVLATVRTDTSGVVRPLRRWLADVRRLPAVSEMAVGRLDRAGTAEQLGQLLGRPPHQSLVEQVHARTLGNAYETALLARGLSPDATSLPPGLPVDLRDAVVRTWAGLDAAARELTRLLAVAGQPLGADDLSVLLGVASVPLLRAAVHRGVLDSEADGEYWFAHPLLAEVLLAEQLPEERRSRHARVADRLRPRGPASPSVGLERAVAIAGHLAEAGDSEGAYAWALAGAEATQDDGPPEVVLRLLQRARELTVGRDVPEAELVALLRRIREAAARAGDEPAELRAVDGLLGLLATEDRPLPAAELLVRRAQLRQSAGRGFAATEDPREAVRLSAASPNSPEHALATAELARVQLWNADDAGAATAESALRLARAARAGPHGSSPVAARALALR